MLIYSHRGESKYAPENTMSAFYLADLINCDGIECDIRKTKDNKLVLIHDKSISRTSNGNGNVDQYTLDQLYMYDFGNKNYKGEKIVTLTDFLNYFGDKSIKLYLEVKESGYEKLIWDTISKYNIDNVEIISFKYEILAKFRNLSKIIKLGWLVYDINEKILFDCKKIKINQVLCLSSTLTKSDVKRLRDHDISIGAWGIKNKSELKRMNSLKIDSIVYDSSYDAKRILKNE